MVLTPLPEGITVIRHPEEAELLDIARVARASHLHLITNGRESVLSPWIPPGWFPLAVRVKESA